MFCRRWAFGQCVKDVFAFDPRLTLAKVQLKVASRGFDGSIRLFVWTEVGADRLPARVFKAQPKSWSLPEQMCWPHKGRWPDTTGVYLSCKLFSKMFLFFFC